jgi:hypothetical protein
MNQKMDQNSSSEGIYTDYCNEEEVGLYVLETIPKVGALSEVDQKVQRDDDEATPCVFIGGEVVEWVSKIQLGPDLRLEERRQYEDLFHKYIHPFVFYLTILQCPPIRSFYERHLRSTALLSGHFHKNGLREVEHRTSTSTIGTSNEKTQWVTLTKGIHFPPYMFLNNMLRCGFGVYLSNLLAIPSNMLLVFLNF